MERGKLHKTDFIKVPFFLSGDMKGKLANITVAKHSCYRTLSDLTLKL